MGSLERRLRALEEHDERVGYAAAFQMVADEDAALLVAYAERWRAAEAAGAPCSKGEARRRGTPADDQRARQLIPILSEKCGAYPKGYRFRRAFPSQSEMEGTPPLPLELIRVRVRRGEGSHPPPSCPDHLYEGAGRCVSGT